MESIASTGRKVCPSCQQSWPLEDFMRRVGQEWFVPPGTTMSRPQEPLREQTEMAICCVCFGQAVLEQSVREYPA